MLGGRAVSVCEDGLGPNWENGPEEMQTSQELCTCGLLRVIVIQQGW